MSLFSLDKEFNRFFHDDLTPYWSQYGARPNKKAAKKLFSDSNGAMDRYYVTSDVWSQHIIPHFNDPLYAQTMSDMNLNALSGRALSRPETLFKRMGNAYCLDDFSPITYEKALSLCRTPGEWVVKSTNVAPSLHQKQFSGRDSEEHILELLRSFDGSDYIVHKRIHTHPDLTAAGQNDDGVIRVTTLLFQGFPHLLSAVLQCSSDNAIISYPILPDGSLGKDAISIEGERISHVSGAKTGGCVPQYEAIQQAALDLALHSPYVQLVTWSFTVSESGDVIYLGFNAIAPLHNQENCGAVFGDLTDIVLSEVFSVHSSSLAEATV